MASREARVVASLLVRHVLAVISTWPTVKSMMHTWSIIRGVSMRWPAPGGELSWVAAAARGPPGEAAPVAAGADSGAEAAGGAQSESRSLAGASMMAEDRLASIPRGLRPSRGAVSVRRAEGGSGRSESLLQRLWELQSGSKVREEVPEV